MVRQRKKDGQTLITWKKESWVREKWITKERENAGEKIVGVRERRLREEEKEDEWWERKREGDKDINILEF